MEKCNAPVEKRRVEVWIRHPAKVGMCPAKRIGEDRLIVDLRDSVMTGSIPCAWPVGEPQHEPKFRNARNRKRSEGRQSEKAGQPCAKSPQDPVFTSLAL